MKKSKQDEFLVEFLKDAHEDLNFVEEELLALEKNISTDKRITRENLNKIFRHVHSIKGNASFFNLSNIVAVAHSGENLLDAIRKRKINFRVAFIELLLTACDLIRKLVNANETNSLNDELINEAITFSARLDQVLADETDISKPRPEEEQKEPARKWMLFSNTNENSDTVKDLPALPGLPEPNSTQVELSNELPRANLLTSDIRVQTEKLDSMLNLIGELVVAESIVNRQTNSLTPNLDTLRKSSRQLSKIVRYLQETALSMRMIPISGTFRKMSRVVRDVARRSGKEVELSIIGEDTEIDKTVVEQISDPLVHLIRNAIDHGIESREERVASSKPPVASLRLEATHSGNEILIKVKDDGRGLNREKIFKKACTLGVLTAADDEIRDDELWQYLFSPGFSTADNITDISGRGVGLDVVKKNLNALRGRVSVQSRPGQETTFIMRIPLTLAIIEGVVVDCDGRYLVIPTESIERFVDLNKEKTSKIHDGMEVIRVNEAYVPIARVSDYLNYRLNEKEEPNDEPKLGIVIENEFNQIAIKAHEIIGSQQVVIKTLSGCLSEVQGLSGGAILGNGEVGLVIDVEHFLKQFSASVEDKIENFAKEDMATV